MHLTPLEYRLLAVLARNPGKVLTHAMLLRAVWGLAYQGETHYVRVYMARLRRKLEDDPSRPRYLLTQSGVGYRLIAELSDDELALLEAIRSTPRWREDARKIAAVRPASIE